MRPKPLRPFWVPAGRVSLRDPDLFVQVEKHLIHAHIFKIALVKEKGRVVLDGVPAVRLSLAYRQEDPLFRIPADDPVSGTDHYALVFDVSHPREEEMPVVQSELFVSTMGVMYAVQCFQENGVAGAQGKSTGELFAMININYSNR